MNPAELIAYADRFAEEAHKDQKRKYVGTPYIEHPRAVAKLVSEVAGHTPEMIAAALLHDTVEDCGKTLAEIDEKFGGDVALLVSWLTDVSKPEDGPREVRKAKDRRHIADGPARAKTIKLADSIDNTRSIVEHDEHFARSYLREKALLLPVLRDGDPTLWSTASLLVQRGCEKLSLCPAVAYDQLARDYTGCALDWEHEGLHDDGCLRWSDECQTVAGVTMANLVEVLRECVSALDAAGAGTLKRKDRYALRARVLRMIERTGIR